MYAVPVGREAELERIGLFLDALGEGPAALVLVGEPGVGKTTLWREGLAEATRRGYRVLASRPVESEARLSYAALGDLLRGIEDWLLDELPAPQRRSLAVALLREGPGGAAPDPRAIATAVLAILERLSVSGPVLVALDDAQWLDRATAAAVRFAARRLTGPVGILATQRAGERPDSGPPPVMADSDRFARLEVRGLDLAGLHRLLQDRTGRSFPRPALARIEAVSGGNPFFALELIRAVGEGPTMAPSTRFPATIAELARIRVRGLDSPARDVLLAAAVLTTPTVELLRRAVDPVAPMLLEQAEQRGIVELDGARVRFTHPLLASGVYAMASAPRRRAMHRRLAGAGLDAEEGARHLALATTVADEGTLRALDEAAVYARNRGAPAAAADLLELALRLGGNDAARTIRAAGHHLDAGDPARARALLERAVARMPPGGMRAEARRLLATVRLHDDSYVEAAALLEGALGDAAGDPQLLTRVALELLYVLTNLGRVDDARRRAEPLVEESERLRDDGLVAQTLAARTIIRFLHGEGLDQAGLERALRLEDRERRGAIMFRPSLMASLLWMWTGELEKARETLYGIRRHCIERGEESDLMFVAFHTAMLECWRGDLAAAKRVADDSMERALQLGTDVARGMALSTRAFAAAYAGEVTEARNAGDAALAIFQRGSCLVATLWPAATLGFLELSLDDAGAAARRLGPMASGAAAMGVGEPVCIPFAADAAEALIAAGNAPQATPLVDLLEEHGRRLDRAWALATGGRCRALLHAARGRLDAAIIAAELALAEHDRLSMPFERARTLLVLGRLRRRRGRRRAAAGALEDALRTFDALGTHLWADKARGELRRLGLLPGPATELTPTERRVAEMIGRGMTNRAVAAAISISPKTVEANLARIYLKLGIRSRAELGRHMAATQPGA